LVFFDALAYFTMYYFGTGWLPYCASAVFYCISLVCISIVVQPTVLPFDHVHCFVTLWVALYDFLSKCAVNDYSASYCIK